MISKLDKEEYVLPSMCDHNGKIGYHKVFSLLTDIATEHAETIGVGENSMMEQGLYWVAIKTKVRFLTRPSMMQKVRIETWPEEPERIRYTRDYKISYNGQTMIAGKTEWAILDVLRNRVYTGKDVYPANQEYYQYNSIPDPYEIPSFQLEESDMVKDYHVKSVDIDLGKHMNNAYYLRAFFSFYSTSEIDEMNIDTIDIYYKKQTLEGETIRFFIKNGESRIDVVGCVQEKIAVTISIMKKR